MPSWTRRLPPWLAPVDSHSCSGRPWKRSVHGVREPRARSPQHAPSPRPPVDPVSTTGLSPQCPQGVAIGRALQPFPRSKRSRHVSAYSAFQLGLSTLEGRIRHEQRRGAPASEGYHLPSSLYPLTSLLTGLP